VHLSELCNPERIVLDLDVSDKNELLAVLAEKGAAIAALDRGAVQKALREREELGSTGLGRGVALPHARIEGLREAVVIVATLVQPIDFEAVDLEPVDVVFMMLLPEGAGAESMKVLAKIAALVRRTDLVDQMRSAETPDEIFGIIEEVDA
jgi:nitrogen PTS system EIIA component